MIFIGLSIKRNSSRYFYYSGLYLRLFRFSPCTQKIPLQFFNSITSVGWMIDLAALDKTFSQHIFSHTYVYTQNPAAYTQNSLIFLGSLAACHMNFARARSKGIISFYSSLFCRILRPCFRGIARRPVPFPRHLSYFPTVLYFPRLNYFPGSSSFFPSKKRFTRDLFISPYPHAPRRIISTLSSPTDLSTVPSSSRNFARDS